jgi:hypothetical protein
MVIRELYRRKGSTEHRLESFDSANLFTTEQQDTPLSHNISVQISFPPGYKCSVSTSQPRRTLKSEDNVVLQCFKVSPTGIVTLVHRAAGV